MLKIIYIFQSISPGLVETEIIPEERLNLMKKNPEYAALRSEDIADGAIYILSTPPYCQVRKFQIFCAQISKFSKGRTNVTTYFVLDMTRIFQIMENTHIL